MGAKLVRDRMGDIPWGDEDAKKYLRPVKDIEEHVSLLMNKFLEEYGELSGVESAEEAAEELADLFEVLDSLISVAVREQELEPNQVREARARKFAERGGFTEGLVFEMNHYTA